MFGIAILVAGVAAGVVLLNAMEGIFIGLSRYVHDESWEDPSYELCANMTSQRIYFHNITNPDKVLAGLEVRLDKTYV